jgi:alkanesulfonate monooxygenase SsuD/methylene tetrahydromethanopterin reductase-like flavin-dependent oxidoreductase (luciferase family)
VLPFRNPLILAEELATVDVLSGGRLVVGVGVGYVQQEFDAGGRAVRWTRCAHRRVSGGDARDPDPAAPEL